MYALHPYGSDPKKFDIQLDDFPQLQTSGCGFQTTQLWPDIAACCSRGLPRLQCLRQLHVGCWGIVGMGRVSREQWQLSIGGRYSGDPYVWSTA